MQWCPGKIDGFIVELNTAGGHNAPPRGKLQLDTYGQPIYGVKDDVDFAEFCKLGIPFWIAGSLASSEGLAKACALGAYGVQAGSIFAFTEESGIEPCLKQKALELIFNKKESVFTSPNASPTGFPFKILRLKDTIFEQELYDSRKRVCSLGYLREIVWLDDKIVFRCAAEPVSDFCRKAGVEIETIGCVCICAGLCATADARAGEIPLVTAGDDLSPVYDCMRGKNCCGNKNPTYTALDAVSYISSS